jgi:hypothetical protein
MIRSSVERYLLFGTTGATVRRGERGAALIIAITLLAIMALLGITLLSVSSSELQLSGNYRNQQEAFYAADRAVEYAFEYITIGGGTVDLYADTDPVDGVTLHRDRVAVGNSGLEAPTASSPPDQNTVVFIGEGPPPVGIGSDANLFKSRNYVITVAAASPVGAANPARAVVRSQVAKIVAK